MNWTGIRFRISCGQLDWKGTHQMARTVKNNPQDIVTILAATVGGAPAPVTFSIATTKPQRVILFPSEGSRRQIDQEGEAPTEPRGRDGRGILQMLREIGHELDRKTLRIDVVEPEDLLPCVEKMRRVLTEELSRYDGEVRLVLNFTGGTKMMSAAMALAGESFPGAEYAYVASRHGGRSRDKGGLGVTIDGQEKQIILENPRNLSAFTAIDDARRLSRSGTWDGAAKLLENHRTRLTDPRRKRELEAWAHLFRVYAEWDRLRYPEALKALRAALKVEARLDVHLGQKEALSLLQRLRRDEATLTTLVEGRDSTAVQYDIVANAERRAGAGQLDEAFQLFYRVVEFAAAARLRDEHDIDADDVKFDILPQSFVAAEGILPPANGRKLAFALQKKWVLLDHLGDEMASRFGALKLYSEKKSRSILDLRNDSILTHGQKRITQNELKRLRYAVYTLLRIDEDGLTTFPSV